MTSKAQNAHSVVIVGGGVGGVSTASALREAGFDGELTIVDPAEIPYDRPPLSKDYLAGTASLEQIALRRPEWYQQNQVRLISVTSVRTLHPAEGKLELSTGAMLSADWVVLATGGSALRPPLPGIDGDRIHVLRTTDDADRLRAALVSGTRVLVVGGGLIGAEVASTALELGADVVLLEPLAAPLHTVLGSQFATWLHELHVARGIEVVRAPVEGFSERSGRVVADYAGQRQEFDLVVLGVGMRPSTELASAAGLQTDRGIIVTPGQVTSNPAVLAVGDSARTRVDAALLPRTEHWDAAQQDGQRAAASITGNPLPASSAPWFWSDRHGRHIEGVGSFEGAERHVVRGEFGSDCFTVFGLRAGIVVGVAAVNASALIPAARRLVDRRVRVIAEELADPGVELRTLLRR